MQWPLIGNEEDIIAIADLTNSLEIAGRRGAGAHRVHEWLGDKTRHCFWTFAPNGVFKIVGADAGILVLGHVPPIPEIVSASDAGRGEIIRIKPPPPA